MNAFVNAGFGNDKLMVEADEGSSWIYKNKDHGKFADLDYGLCSLSLLQVCSVLLRHLVSACFGIPTLV